MCHDNLLLAVKDAKYSKALGNGHASPPSECRKPPLTLRVFPVSCPPQGHAEHTPKDTGGLYVDTRMPTKKDEDEAARIAHNNARANRVTNERLFCRGEREDDGFSRTIAIRYLSKRMVYAARSTAKGKEAEPDKVSARKTSSSRHAVPFFNASDIEDIVQDAYMIWAGMTEHTIKDTGNRLYDTCTACSRAYTRFMRQRYKERKRLDILAARHTSRENKERSLANKFYDAELEELLKTVRVHGWTDQKTLAEVIGVSAGELCKRLARLRARNSGK